MNDAGTLSRHMLDIRELTAEAFAPYGQVIAPLRTGGQGAETGYDPEASFSEAKLVLGNGEPRLWIMHLPHVGLGFTRIARHRRVTQCLGALGGKEWLIGVAPSGDLDDDARPRIEDIAAFRVPGDRLIKLHVATWHAGPHFVHDECLFVNPENLDTNRVIFTPCLSTSSAATGSERPLFADYCFLMVSPADTSEGSVLERRRSSRYVGASG
jgi:ureidoglycolate lyase